MEISTSTVSFAKTLQCPQCEKSYDIYTEQSYATCCNQPLITLYNQNTLNKKLLPQRVQSMWRYIELLPLFDEENIVSLGEGWTKILRLDKLAAKSNLSTVLLKDESTNPTGSFKARGISMAISKAKELGIQHCIIPTAGNAGGALSAYCAKAGIGATVIMPRHTANALKEECKLYGAELILLDGLIDSCGKKAKQLSEEKGHFDMSTMKEPFRLEGKKTIGFEIAEQLNWKLPDVIIYPTGGGTGLIGMWKAFAEMKQLGWITGKLPRMVIVQSDNCAPMMHMYKTGKISPDFKPEPSLAYGLAVPYPFAKDLMMKVINESNGTVVTVSEDEIEKGIEEIASDEGLLLSPEGSSTCVAMQKLAEAEWIQEHETVLLFNTGSWYKYR
ncbi:MAG TPA: threonine synthase [Segetibacter sp.]|jgi:threonine synthase